VIDLRQGDCLEVMRTLPDNSVHACVTDPPYGLAFMGKKWDYDVPTEDVWREVLRILKPGGFLLSFSGTRTYHRMTVRIEDAGFEIRDMIQWLYGSGFPKSHDISKAIDREAGAEREVIGQHERSNLRKNGAGFRNLPSLADESRGTIELTAPATDAAKQWEGWGTALKPANEPVCVARKPLVGTVAQNVLAHGCGGLNIDGCRVGTEDRLGGGAVNGSVSRSDGWDRPWKNDAESVAAHAERVALNVARAESLGRWPANVVHDGSDEVLELFPQTGPAKRAMRGEKTSSGTHEGWARESHAGFDSVRGHEDHGGSAARFFYSAKADRAEREKGVDSIGVMRNDGRQTEIDNPYQCGKVLRNHHPTVKPVDLMRWLVRLVCPPHGVVLDPYTGSGTTGVACRLEGFGFIGIELNPEYIELARQRINAETPSLFAGLDE